MTKKKTNKKSNHSAFEGKTIGKSYPKGTTFKKNSDGTISPISPKKRK